MSRTWICGLAVVGSLLLTLGGCEKQPSGDGRGASTQPAAASSPVTLSDVKQKAQVAASTAAELFRQTRDRYQQDAEKELDRIEQRIVELHKKLGSASEEAKPELERKLNELAEKAIDIRDRLGKLKEAGEEAWKELRVGLDGAFRDLQKRMTETGVASQPTSGPDEPPPE